MTRLEKLRAGFLARSRREKVLTVLFVVVLAALWLVWLLGRTRAFGAELAGVQSTAEEQANWLSLDASIRERYEAAVAALPANPPTADEAFAVIDQIVRKYDVRFRFDRPKPSKADQLTLHPIDVNISRARYRQLVDLFNEISTALPTVNLDEVKIALPDRNNHDVLDAQFKFVAIEFNR